MYSVQDLPEPEAYNSKEEPWPEYHPSEYDQGPTWDAIKRWFKNIESVIFVENAKRNKYPIMVVTSHKRPCRLVAGGSIDGNASGAGLSLDTVQFEWPATKKPIRPGCKASFPTFKTLGTDLVISIYNATTGEALIENDKVRIGSRVVYTDGQDLVIYRVEETVGKTDAEGASRRLA